jgi:hypothetical protein
MYVRTGLSGYGMGDASASCYTWATDPKTGQLVCSQTAVEPGDPGFGPNTGQAAAPKFVRSNPNPPQTQYWTNPAVDDAATNAYLKQLAATPATFIGANGGAMPGNPYVRSDGAVLYYKDYQGNLVPFDPTHPNNYNMDAYSKIPINTMKPDPVTGQSRVPYYSDGWGQASGNEITAQDMTNNACWKPASGGAQYRCSPNWPTPVDFTIPMQFDYNLGAFTIGSWTVPGSQLQGYTATGGTASGQGTGTAQYPTYTPLVVPPYTPPAAVAVTPVSQGVPAVSTPFTPFTPQPLNGAAPAVENTLSAPGGAQNIPGNYPVSSTAGLTVSGPASSSGTVATSAPAATDFLGSITDWITANPMLAAVGAVGIAVMFLSGKGGR